MYLEPFKLKELPFRLSPDPQFLYLSKQHAAPRPTWSRPSGSPTASLVITGEIGSGKTTLIESFSRKCRRMW